MPLEASRSTPIKVDKLKWTNNWFELNGSIVPFIQVLSIKVNYSRNFNVYQSINSSIRFTEKETNQLEAYKKWLNKGETV